jgi:glycosyltransferase involved in cell wall biosynthesis
MTTNAAIFFDPDGYLLTGPKLMGRQAAGYAFLRAAVMGRQGQPLWVYTPQESSAQIFSQLVRDFDPEAQTCWVGGDRVDLLAEIGTLYFPGPGLADAARLRLRLSPVAYSLVGVTHTTASHIAMDSITEMLTAPVMPWDALICTSKAVAGTVKTLLEAEIDYLHWRFGKPLKLTLPQLPVIPLGVHCLDFDFSSEERARHRQRLNIAEGEIVVLFVGRLSFHAKAHPHPMYLGLQTVAERTGQKITLIQAGWFANEAIESAFKSGARQYCPSVRMLFTDGKKSEVCRQSWAAADLFISLADNIQETFGLTPIEAMAAGLPVIVSDWNGYQDTVREGIDGFRIPTWMPPPNLGDAYARAYEAGIDNYDFYCGLTCQTVSVDLQILIERLSDLVSHPELRAQMGRAGQTRAREVFDWAVVYRHYQNLWAQLGDIRRAAAKDTSDQPILQAAPKVAPSRMDPFRSFGHYPTRQIQADTWVRRLPGGDLSAYRNLIGHSLYNYAAKILPAPEVVEKILAALQNDGLQTRTLAERTKLDLGGTVMAISVLAKMGLVRLAPSTREDHSADSVLLAQMPPTSQAILEIGCGDGQRGRHDRTPFHSKVRYIGVERSESAGRQAAAYLDHVIIGDIEQAETLAALDRVRGEMLFDTLIFADSLERLHEPRKVLEVLRSRVMNGGFCVTRITNVAHWSVIVQQLQGRWDDAENGCLDRSRLRFFTRETAIELFQQAGWIVQDAKPLLLEPEQTQRTIQILEPLAASFGIGKQDFHRELSAFQWIIRAVNGKSN